MVSELSSRSAERSERLVRSLRRSRALKVRGSMVNGTLDRGGAGPGGRGIRAYSIIATKIEPARDGTQPKLFHDARYPTLSRPMARNTNEIKGIGILSENLFVAAFRRLAGSIVFLALNPDKKVVPPPDVDDWMAAENGDTQVPRRPPLAADHRSELSRPNRTKAPISAGISSARTGSLFAGIVRLSRN